LSVNARQKGATGMSGGSIISILKPGEAAKHGGRTPVGSVVDRFAHGRRGSNHWGEEIACFRTDPAGAAEKSHVGTIEMIFGRILSELRCIRQLCATIPLRAYERPG